MGKGLDTCLVVQPMVVQTADPTEVVITERKKKLVQMMTTTAPGSASSATLLRQETAEDLQNKLDQFTELPESDSFPMFHLLPEVLQHWSKLMLLPPELKSFMVETVSAQRCLKRSKDVTIAAYTNARKLLGAVKAVVCIPPKELLQDPDIQTKVLWEGMAIIRPWDAIPAEVLAMEPHIYEDVAIRSGELDEEQKEVLQGLALDFIEDFWEIAVQEIQALVEAAEFMHYWSRKGCTLELETEYEP